MQWISTSIMLMRKELQLKTIDGLSYDEGDIKRVLEEARDGNINSSIPKKQLLTDVLVLAAMLNKERDEHINTRAELIDLKKKYDELLKEHDELCEELDDLID